MGTYHSVDEVTSLGGRAHARESLKCGQERHWMAVVDESASMRKAPFVDLLFNIDEAYDVLDICLNGSVE